MSTPRNYKIAKWLMGISACTILAFGLMSFQNKANKNSKEITMAQFCKDTVPDKQISAELEKAMKELGEALGQVGKELQKIDFNKMNKELEISLKDVNIEKIMSEVRHAIEKADVSKITRELEMSKADHQKLQMEIEKDLKEGLKELKEINWQELEGQLKDMKLHIKDFDSEKLKTELEKIKPVIKEKMEELKEEMKKIEKEKKKGSGYACIRICPKMMEAMEMDMEFTPDIPVEPMI